MIIKILLNFTKYFSLLFSVLGAILLGFLQKKKQEEINKINNHNDQLYKIIEIERKVSNYSDVDRAKLLFNEIKSD